MLRHPILAASASLLLAGCGAEGAPESATPNTSQSTGAPVPKVTVEDGIGQAQAASPEAADAACEALQEDPAQANGATQVNIRIPGSNGADTTCVLPEP